MNVWHKVKNWFIKGGDIVKDAVLGEELQSILDHPKINCSAEEVARVKDNFNLYAGKAQNIKYINSKGVEKSRQPQILNMTKEIAEYMSQIVFNEQCEITVGDDNNLNKANEFIQHVFNHNKFKKNFSKYLEVMFATGGLAVRPYVDNGEIEFSWCLADAFYPLKSNTNNISECVIPSVSAVVVGDKTIYYTLLEFHEWQDEAYIITNELYKSTQSNIVGRRVALNELYPDLEEETKLVNLERPLFCYLKPFGFNNISPRSPLGLSLIDNVKTTLTQINTVYDAFYWEIKQGKRRVIVSDHFLRGDITQDGQFRQVFDDDTDVFLALKGDIDDMTNRDITHEIRSSQYIDSLNKFFSTLEMQVGLSTGTFTFNGSSVKTATEIVSENSQTFRTRNAHITEIEEFIKELVIAVFELAVIHNLYTGDIPTSDDIGVDFDDGVFTDKNSQLDYLSKASVGGFIPKVEVIQRLFNVPEEVANQWIAQMNDEAMSSNPVIQSEVKESNFLGGDE